MLFLLANGTEPAEEASSTPAPGSQDDCDELAPGVWACIDNVLQDEELINSMKLSSILGVSCFFLFGILQTIFPLYKIRLYLPQVTVKPPRLPTRGFQVLWKWLYNIVFTSDQHLLASSGLDALILVKTMGFGVQLFLPLAIVAGTVLIPLHRRGTYSDEAVKGSDAPLGRFMSMTMSNLEPGTSVFWVHFWCVYAFIGYTLLLLFFQHKRFVRLRHHYLTSGDDPNLWRMKYQANTPRISTPKLGNEFGMEDHAPSPVAKMRMLMKMVTGIGKDDMFEEALNFEPQGLMGKASRVREEVNKELLDKLQHRSASMVTIKEGETPRLDPVQVQPRTIDPSPDSATLVPEIQVEDQSGIVPGPFSASGLKQKPKINISLSNVVKKVTKSQGIGSSDIYKWWDIDFDGLEDDADELTTPKVRASGQPSLTARPSIRYLRTINTEDPVLGEQVAVNAQQYCVLITDVPDVQKMVERKQKKEERRNGKKTKGRRVWEFLHTWVGGGMSLKSFHPSANSRAAEKRPEPDVLERGGILSISMALGDLGDPLVESTKSGEGSNWGKVAQKISSEEIFHLEEALVEDSFKILFPDDFVRAVPIRNHKPVDDLLLQLDNYQAQLEKAEEYCNRTGKRATKWQWNWNSRSCIEVDQISHCKLNIARLEREIGDAQKRIMREKPSPSWLLIFRTQHSATVAAQTLLHSESSHKFKAYPAPGPEEMNWQALWKTWVEKDVRSVIVFPFLVFLCLLPIGLAMGAMSRLNNFLCGRTDSPWYWNAYCAKNGDNESRLRSLVTGWLPPILVSVWQNMIMPKSLYYLAQARATCISLSQLDREIASLFFYWDVFNIFIGAMMGGTLFSSELFRKFKTVSSVLDLLGAAVPASANFFVNYMTLRAFFLMPYQLLAPHPGIWAWLFKLGGRCGCARTKRQKTELYRPASIRFGREYGLLLLIFLIALCYSIVAPIIVPITALLFILSWVTWRYQVLYVFVRKYESGGRMWPVVFNRILYCLFLFQFFTSCVLLIKKSFTQAAILWITVPIILIRFRGYCNDRFRAGMEFIPLEMAFHSPPADIDPKVYTPPALIKGCAGWHPEYMKAWEGWGAPGYVV
ncbi:hypothetical protein BSKO_09874 [Bryopsis sp. KO-2023]|nr:hypothetical protein BSKO_09874 [Bryopsis sp. KO-2023]